MNFWNSFFKPVIRTNSSLSIPFFNSKNTYLMYSATANLVEKWLRFSQDPALVSRYSNHFGDLRVGPILEDLDSFAGAVGYNYFTGASDDDTKLLDIMLSDPRVTPFPIYKKQPYRIVTASCNQINLKKPLETNQDLRIRGFVTYVGTTSMEVKADIDVFDENGNSENVLCSYFTMVARDHDNKPVTVPKLDLVTIQQKEEYEGGKKRRENRQILSKKSLEIVPPTDFEREIIHNKILESLKDKKEKSKNRVWMEKAKLESVKVMLPQQRNVHGKVFGGFLLRTSYELAWSTVLLYTNGKRPFFSALDDTSFISPVDVGSITKFVSEITYVTSEPQNSVQVRVATIVINPETSEKNTTNVFNYTFTFNEDFILKDLCPKTYIEAMKYIEGKRFLENNRS